MDKIIVNNLRKKTKNFLLQHASFTVHSGEIFALCGIQNSGKTLLTKTIQKLCFPDFGTISIGNDFGFFIPDQMFDPNMTVYGAVCWTVLLNKRPLSHFEILNILNLVGLKARRNMRIRHLTPNRQTRLKIACAIVARPSVLVLDAPFSYLSEFEARQIRIILKTLCDRFQTSILLTGVNFYGIEEIFDTAAIIDGGKIVTVTSYNELNKINEPYAKMCITTNAPNLCAKLVADTFHFKTHLYGDNDVIVGATPEKAQGLYDFLRNNNVDITCITRVNKSIQELFQTMRTCQPSDNIVTSVFGSASAADGFGGEK
jgi:ABC-2 type transport system ATP-binding protein